MSAFFAIFRPLTGNKTSPNYFFLVEEVLSFDLVGHIWKSVKNWLQEWVFNIYKWKLGRSRWIAYLNLNYLQKWFGDRYGEFPTAFPTRISHKIFLSWILIGGLPITLFQMLNFHQSLPFSNWIFPLLLVPQDFPTRFSRNNFPQDFPARFSRKNFAQDFPTRFSRNNFPQDFPARFSRKIFPSWILIGWLPITLFQMLNFHQSQPC